MSVNLNKLEELMRAATPGPWELQERAGGHGIFAGCYRDFGGRRTRVHGLNLGHISDCDSSGDATRALLIAARNALPGLVAEVRALRARVAELENQLEHMGNVSLLSGGRGRVLFSEEGQRNESHMERKIREAREMGGPVPLPDLRQGQRKLGGDR